MIAENNGYSFAESLDLTGQDSTSIYSGICTDADSRSGRSRISRGNGDDGSQVHAVSTTH